MSGEFELVGPDLRKFAAYMRHSGQDVRPKFKEVHTKFAGKIRDDIKNQMPKTGGMSKMIGKKGGGISRPAVSRSRVGAAKRKEGRKHDTPRGAMSASVKTRISAYSSSVVGGGGAHTGHYAVNEFGGAVWWHKHGSGWARGSFGHKAYAESYAKTRRLSRERAGEREKKSRFGGHIIAVRKRSPQRGRGAEGWVFYPVFYATMPKIEDAYDKALDDVMKKNLAKFKGSSGRAR